VATRAESTEQSHLSEMWASLAKVASILLFSRTSVRVQYLDLALLSATFARIPPNALALAKPKGSLDSSATLGYTREKQGGITSADSEDSNLYAKVPFRPG
jgi:hypothetical protein